MAQIKIVNFDLVPVNNSFFKESRKLNVDFELILMQIEMERNSVFEVEFSLSSFTGNGRVIRAMAGKKNMCITPNDPDIRTDKKYELDEQGKWHYRINFVSEDIPELLLTGTKSDNAMSNLFVTAT